MAQWTAHKAQADDRFRPLPTVLRLGDGSLLVGVGVQRTQMYSGGNAEVVFQRIMLIRAGSKPVAVLEAPYSSDIATRACFSEKDTRQRLGACTDEYSLISDLKIAPGAQGGLPNLSLDVSTTRFPRGVSRQADSLAMPPLRQADLIEQVDPACTYRRIYTFDPVAGAYRPDAALPPCEDFTVP